MSLSGFLDVKERSTVPPTPFLVKNDKYERVSIFILNCNFGGTKNKNWDLFLGGFLDGQKARSMLPASTASAWFRRASGQNGGSSSSGVTSTNDASSSSVAGCGGRPAGGCGFEREKQRQKKQRRQRLGEADKIASEYIEGKRQWFAVKANRKMLGVKK